MKEEERLTFKETVHFTPVALKLILTMGKEIILQPFVHSKSSRIMVDLEEKIRVIRNEDQIPKTPVSASFRVY